MPKQQQTITVPDELVASEACEVLRIDKRTLFRYVAAGRVRPSRKLPGRTGAYLFARAHIEEVAAAMSAGASR